MRGCLEDQAAELVAIQLHLDDGFPLLSVVGLVRLKSLPHVHDLEARLDAGRVDSNCTASLTFSASYFSS